MSSISRLLSNYSYNIAGSMYIVQRTTNANGVQQNSLLVHGMNSSLHPRKNSRRVNAVGTGSVVTERVTSATFL